MPLTTKKPAGPYVWKIGETLFFDVCAATGRSARQLPRELKPQGLFDEENGVPLAWLHANVGPWADPRSYGLWGNAVPVALGYKPGKHFNQRCIGVSSFDYIVTIGDSPNNRIFISTVNSTAPHSADLVEYRHSQRLTAGFKKK